MQELLDVLAPDVVVVADGGGIAPAIRAPVHGAERVARLLARFTRIVPEFEAATVWLNGAPAARLDIDGELSTALGLVVEDGRIARIYAIRNPHKLARLDRPAALAR